MQRPVNATHKYTELVDCLETTMLLSSSPTPISDHIRSQLLQPHPPLNSTCLSQTLKG